MRDLANLIRVVILSFKKKLCCTQEEEDPDIVIEVDLITQEDLTM